METFDLVKTFSATRHRERDGLGERVTEFMQSFDGKVVGRVVRQSSDREFHCLTIVLFGKKNRKRRREHGRLGDQD